MYPIEKLQNYIWKKNHYVVDSGFGKWEVLAPMEEKIKIMAKAVKLGLYVETTAYPDGSYCRLFIYLNH